MVACLDILQAIVCVWFITAHTRMYVEVHLVNLVFLAHFPTADAVTLWSKSYKYIFIVTHTLTSWIQILTKNTMISNSGLPLRVTTRRVNVETAAICWLHRAIKLKSSLRIFRPNDWQISNPCLISTQNANRYRASKGTRRTRLPA